MAYPTSVFAPATRSNGQTIDAAHLNDVQAEITAVENALLGTITHSINVSGASTLATLRATNSTLTTLECGASTFSVRPVTPPPDAAKVYLDSTVTIGSSGQSTIAFVAQDFRTNSSLHSTATNPARLTPQSTGLYQCVFQAGFSPTSGAIGAVLLRDSSGTAFAVARAIGSTDIAFTQVVGYKRFDVVGGYVVATITLAGYSTLSLSTGIDGTWFAMHKL